MLTFKTDYKTLEAITGVVLSTSVLSLYPPSGDLKSKLLRRLKCVVSLGLSSHDY